MIVAIGVPALVEGPSGGEPGGLAGSIAVSIAREQIELGEDPAVQLAGRVGDDPAGDRLLLALAGARVGHAAMLRDPGRRTPVIEASESGGALGALAEGSSQEAPIRDAGLQERLAPSLDAGDVELALRYLVDFRVLVVAAPLDLAATGVVIDAAAEVDALLVAVGADALAGEPPSDATVLEAPEEDPDGTFARLVARYAVALGSGRSAADAFRDAIAEGGWETAIA